TQGRGRTCPQGQAMELLAMCSRLEHLPTGRCQTALHPVGGTGAQRHSGHPVECRQGQMDATHEPDSSSVRSMKARMMPRGLPHFLRRLLQRLLLLALGLLALSVLLVLALRWIPPPGTALMVERKVQ